VNEIVARFHNDYAALRRYLVDESSSRATTGSIGAPEALSMSRHAAGNPPESPGV
jgi:hypothetical protein